MAHIINSLNKGKTEDKLAFCFSWDDEGEKSSIDKSSYRQMLINNYEPVYDTYGNDIFHFILNGKEK